MLKRAKCILICLLVSVSLVLLHGIGNNVMAAEPQRLDVPNFRQVWEPWKSQNVGTSSNSIEMAGCALTSLAMVLKYYGVETDPEELNNWLISNGGYLYGSSIIWSKAAERGYGIKYVGRQDFNGDADLERIKSEIDNGYPVIAQMGYKGTSHYAVICGYQDNTFYLNDPWYEDPSHTIDSVVKQGSIDVQYDDCGDPLKAIKAIVVFRTENPTPPKVPVIKVKSMFENHPDVFLHPVKMPVMELKVDDPIMLVNGVEKKIDPDGNASPRIVGDRTLIPIRAIVEEMGGQVEWDGHDRKAIIKVQDRTMEMWIGKKTAYNNMWYFEFDVVPQIIDGRTMIPLRAVVEQLGCSVEWDEKAQKITLSPKK